MKPPRIYEYKFFGIATEQILRATVLPQSRCLLLAAVQQMMEALIKAVSPNDTNTITRSDFLQAQAPFRKVKKILFSIKTDRQSDIFVPSIQHLQLNDRHSAFTAEYTDFFVLCNFQGVLWTISYIDSP